MLRISLVIVRVSNLDLLYLWTIRCRRRLQCTKFIATFLGRLWSDMKKPQICSESANFCSIVRELQVRKWMFTYRSEGQFYFMFILYLKIYDKYICVCWTSSNFFWAPANTFFFLKFSYKTTIAKMVKFQIHLWKKNTYGIRKVWLLRFSKFFWVLSVWKRIFRLVPGKLALF